MVAILAPIISQAFRHGARYIYRGLRAQDRLIDYTYRRTGLYNRGVVRGIKHGLIAGQVIGGTLNLGLPGDIENGLPEKPKFPTSRKFRKTRSRYKYDYRSRNKYSTSKFSNNRRHCTPCKCC